MAFEQDIVTHKKRFHYSMVLLVNDHRETLNFLTELHVKIKPYHTKIN